jgi:transposase
VFALKRFIEGESRTQTTLLPECLDDYISEANSVRVVDVFVDELNLAQLGFDGVAPAITGRPSYHPSVMLKIYIYGYLNRIQSSRRLEREAQRNVELMWLSGKLTPDFKTIANFRKDNGKAIIKVCRQFVLLCQQLGLFSEAIVAVDGSKFKAVNNRDRNFTSAKLQRRMEEIENSIQRYLTALDSADRQEPATAAVNAERLQNKITVLKAKMAELKTIEVALNQTPDKQISLTDPDARSMKSRGNGIVGYNVQTAVDTKNHLIVAHDVNNEGSDRSQLSKMAQQAKTAMAVEKLTAIADRGYFKSEEIQACDEAQISAIVPKCKTSGANAEGRFDKSDFIYDAQTNAYQCPAGEQLTQRCISIEKGQTLHKYWSSKCQDCHLKAQCTPGKERRVTRWEHENILDAMQTRLDQMPDAMRIRKSTVEHPFGTLKEWMGATHFLTKGLEHVRTEMSLHILAYNMKRVMKIVGIENLMMAMRA